MLYSSIGVSGVECMSSVPCVIPVVSVVSYVFRVSSFEISASLSSVLLCTVFVF